MEQDHDSVVEWRDVTPRRQGPRTEPHVFSAKSGLLDITVLDSHRDWPGEWVMHCYALNISTRPLKATTYKDARREAWEVVESYLNKLQADLGRIPYEGKT